MEQNQINLSVPADYSGKPIVLHLLEGQAPNPVNLNGFSISGDINSVYEFLQRQSVPPELVFVSADIDRLTISAEINPGKNAHKISVSGKIEANPDLAKFRINNDCASRFSPNEFASLIKLSRRYFSSQLDHSKLLMNLRNHTAKIELAIEDSSDDRGNKKASAIGTLTTDIDERFVLNMPIFKGGPIHKFEVNICLEVRDKGISIWLESVELKEIEQETGSAEINKQIALIRAHGNYTIIFK